MNTKSLYTSVLAPVCLSTALMFAVVVSHAQEPVLLQEQAVVSEVPDDVPQEGMTVEAKHIERELPKAENVDLKEVVDEPEVQASSTDYSPSLLPASQSDLLSLEAQAVVPETVVTDEQAVLQETVVIEERAVLPETVAIEEQTAVLEAIAIEEKVALQEQAVIEEQVALEAQAANDEPAFIQEQKPSEATSMEDNIQEVASKFILGMEVPANTATRLVWTIEDQVSGLAEQTPVLIVNGKSAGNTLCMTAAVHGDELNGIEMIRRIMYQLEPEKLTGTVIGVPVVNLMGFRRNSRYLPDRRDLNRFFPGNTRGSSASRIAHSFFTKVIRHCDALIDIHTGSLNRTNLTQLRADLSNQQVAALAQNFGPIAVLNSRGNPRSLRAAAVRAGIPTITIEAGEPMRMQRDVVVEGTKAIETLMAKMDMYGRSQRKSSRYAPVYYKSSWVRANQSGIFFSNAPLGQRVVEGEVLGTVTDPITNRRSEIRSPYRGRILGMALDQVVLPGYAIYHIGIQTPEAILIEEGGLFDEENPDEEALIQSLEVPADAAHLPTEIEVLLDDDE